MTTNLSRDARSRAFHWFGKKRGPGTLLAMMICAGVSLGVPAAVALEDVLVTPSMATQKATESLLLDVAVAGASYVAVGERGHAIYSTDGGVTWQQGAVPVSTTLTSVFFVDEQYGWAVGHGGVILSTSDGGRQWVKQFDGNLANQMVIQAAESRVKRIESELDAAADDDKGDIEAALEEAQFALEDAKTDAATGPSKPLLDVWFKDRNLGFVVGAYGFCFKTTDGGQTWENWAPKLENPDRFHLNAIGRITGDALFLVGEGGMIFSSTDFGDSWKRLESPYEGSLFGLTGTGNVNEVLVFGLRGHVFKSVDLGRTWEKVESGTTATLSAGAPGEAGNVTLVGAQGVVAVSNNSGDSFIAKERADRLALTAIAHRKDQALLLFGEGGVVIANSKGNDL